MHQSKFTQHLIDLEKSGMTVAEYARAVGLKTQALYQARRSARLKKSQPGAPSATSNFIRLVAPPIAATRERIVLEMTANNQWCLRMESLTLVQINRVLGALGQELAV